MTAGKPADATRICSGRGSDTGPDDRRKNIRSGAEDVRKKEV